jgi:TRAP transporter TAXI family solute receptor
MELALVVVFLAEDSLVFYFTCFDLVLLLVVVFCRLYLVATFFCCIAGTIDATLLIVGHPNAAVARALANCDTVLVPFAGPAIDAVLAESSDFEPAVIPAGTYPGLDSDISSFAVMATIVTLESTDSDLVSTLVSRTLENLPALGQRAPVLSVLDPSDMATRGLTAPIHPGGAAAFAAGRSE